MRIGPRWRPTVSQQHWGKIYDVSDSKTASDKSCNDACSHSLGDDWKTQPHPQWAAISLTVWGTNKAARSCPRGHLDLICTLNTLCMGRSPKVIQNCLSALYAQALKITFIHWCIFVQLRWCLIGRKRRPLKETLGAFPLFLVNKTVT